MNDKKPLGVIESLAHLAVGLGEMPGKLGPANAHLSAARQKLIVASFGLEVQDGRDPSEKLNDFQDALKAVRLACYEHIAAYTHLVGVLDAAQREVCELVRQGKANE